MWWTVVLYIVAAAIFLRFYDLPLKPLHHDEGVNTLLLTKLVDPPHTYRYDPANYHGPTLYYAAWLSVAGFGLTTVAIRMVTAVAGLLTVVLVLSLRRFLGPVAALTAAAFIAVSPGAVFFSRYFIHEALLVCFTLGAVVFSATWASRGRTIDAVIAGACAGLMFATKETAVISAAVLALALAGTVLLVPRGVRSDLRTPTVGALLLSAVAFAAVNVLFYTSLFNHWQGLRDALEAFRFWSKTGTSAHRHPWYLYMQWLRAEELPLLLGGTVGAVVALWQRSSALAVFAALWAGGALAAYSLIPYKTPWLLLNAIVPLAVCAGYACERAWRGARARATRVAFGAVLSVLLAGAAVQCVRLNFFRYDDDRNPYVYAHTLRDVLGLVHEIDTIETRNPGASIAVASPDHFPLSWYLRAYPAGYYGRQIVTGDPLVIASTGQQPYFDRALGRAYERRGQYRLRPGVTLVLYARRDLRR